MFPITITAAQAIATNLDASRYNILIMLPGVINRGKYKQVTKLINEAYGEIRCIVDHGKRQSSCESLDPSITMMIMNRYETPQDPNTYANVSPLNEHRYFSPNKSTYLFSQEQGQKKLRQLENLKRIDVLEVIVVWEVMLEQMTKDTGFGEMLAEYKGRHGVLHMRDKIIELGPQLGQAHMIAQQEPDYRCDGIAWDYEFIPEYLIRALKPNLELKSNWREIADQLGAFYQKQDQVRFQAA